MTRTTRKKAAKKTLRKSASSKVKKRAAAPRKTIKRKTAPKKKKTAAKKKAAVGKSAKRTTAPRKTIKRKAAPKKKKTAAKKKATVGKPTKRTAAHAKKVAKKTRGRIVKPEEAPGAFKKGKAYQLKKGEDYMSPQQLGHFNTLLLNWKKELMKEVDRTVNHMQADVTNFADPADRATQEEEFGLELRTRDRERKLIKKIDEALGMIGTEEYGYCNLCGAEIGIRRLEARPTATLCIDCKTLQEVRERQVAD